MSVMMNTKRFFARIGKNNGILNYQPDQMLVANYLPEVLLRALVQRLRLSPKEPTEIAGVLR
jgi:hypothetical protein